MPQNVVVFPGAINATHDISLSDGMTVWGLRLQGGARGIQEIPQTPSTLYITTGGGTKFGDYSPDMSHIEQRDWTGGRGQEEFADDPTRYFDGEAAWTLTPGRVLPAPQWKKSTGLFNEDKSLPGHVKWQPLYSSQRYLAESFAASASYNAEYAQIWLRRRGTPGTFTLELRSDSAGDPGTVLKTVTATATNVADTVSVYRLFDWTTTQALVSGTTYWIVVYGAAADSEINHWEVGCDTTAAGKSSAAGVTWAATAFAPYFSVVEARTTLQYRPFILEGALYVVSTHNNGTTASKVYINGDRGIATAGASTTLTDTAKAWTADVWIGARVKITKGTGINQSREITDNTATVLTVDPAWDINPNTTSEYVIYQTGRYTEVTTTGLTIVSDVAVADNIAIFAQGQGTNIRKMRWNSATPGHDFADDGTNKANLVHVFYDKDDGVQVWVANSSAATAQRATMTAWGTGLTLGTAIDVGDSTNIITQLTDYDDQVWVMKADSAWYISNDKAYKVPVGLDSDPEPTNGLAVAAQNLFLYFSWSHSLERYYAGTMDDIGPWKDAGLPSTRVGPIVAIEPVISWLFAAIDSQPGTANQSGVLAWNGRGWHDIFRGWLFSTNANFNRVRNIKWFPCEGGRNQLWINIGNDLVYMEFPKDTLNPLRDSSHNYQHEYVVVSSTIYPGSINLPKYFKELSATAQNLQDGVEIFVDFQYDDDIGTANWIYAGVLTHSPEESINFDIGNVRALRYRLRANTDTSTTPPVVLGTVVQGFARTPVKYQYNLRIRVRDLARDKQGGEDADADQLTTWLKLAARSARKIRMRSVWEQLDNKLVIVEPPSIARTATNAILNIWGSTQAITLREV